jgi:hypothetical protein
MNAVRRIGGLLWNLFAGLSLFAFLVTLILLIRGIFVGDSIGYQLPHEVRAIGFQSCSGTIQIFSVHSFRMKFQSQQQGPAIYTEQEQRNAPTTGRISISHFRPGPVIFSFTFISTSDPNPQALPIPISRDRLHVSSVNTTAYRWLVVTVPDWLILILTIIPPILWYRRYRPLRHLPIMRLRPPRDA